MSYYESYLFEKRAGLLDDRELRAVNALSSHIETSRAHAFVSIHFIQRTQQIHERYSRLSSLSEKMKDSHLLKPHSDPLFLGQQSPDWSVFDL